MKKFVFGLKSLLRVKESMERQYKNELAILNANKNKMLDNITNLNNKYEKSIELLNSGMSDGVTVSEVFKMKAIIDYTEKSILTAENKVKEIEKEIEKTMNLLVEVIKEKKLLYKLKEKKFQEYMLEYQRNTDKELDDFISYTTNVNKESL